MDFPFDAIEKLRNLEAFTLEKSRVRLLPRFNGLNRLKHIRIDGSLISGFPVGGFANMAAVKQIHVVNSEVTTLAEGIFGRYVYTFCTFRQLIYFILFKKIE